MDVEHTSQASSDSLGLGLGFSVGCFNISHAFGGSIRFSVSQDTLYIMVMRTDVSHKHGCLTQVKMFKTPCQNMKMKRPHFAVL